MVPKVLLLEANEDQISESEFKELFKIAKSHSSVDWQNTLQSMQLQSPMPNAFNNTTKILKQLGVESRKQVGVGFASEPESEPESESELLSEHASEDASSSVSQSLEVHSSCN